MNSTSEDKPGAHVFEAVDLKKEYDGGKVRALRGVSFVISDGELVSVTGTSGSGKTTLLQMLGALDSPTSGELKFRGKPIGGPSAQAAYRSKEIGFVFQSFHLLPTFTAIENVQIPMLESDLPAKARKERAGELLKAVGLDHRASHFPNELSGGERQRVAIARSMANEPSVLLADEPTGNLDSDNAKAIMELILEVHTERKMTIVLITHDMEVARVAPRTLSMRDGQIISDGALTEASGAQSGQ